MTEIIKNGIYRHYKGNEYRLIDEARSTSDESDIIIYQSLADNKVWARPKDEFIGEVELDGKKEARFAFLRMSDSVSDKDRYPEAVVGPLIYNDKGEILLIKSPHWGDNWAIPGGHIELNESAEEAVKRETKEETGLELKNIEFVKLIEGINPPDFHQKKHFVYLNYFAELAGGKITKSDEMTDYIWVNPESVDISSVKDSVRPLINLFVETKIKKESWENKYKRALADYQNLLKQTAKEKTDFAKYAIGEFLQDVLPVYDHLKMSLAGLKEDDNGNPWVEGVRHVLKQFKEVLNRHGVEEIKTVGEKFDHNTMEALSGEGKIVKSEVMAGYKLGDKVVRAAKVIVE